MCRRECSIGRVVGTGGRGNNGEEVWLFLSLTICVWLAVCYMIVNSVLGNGFCSVNK